MRYKGVTQRCCHGTLCPGNGNAALHSINFKLLILVINIIFYFYGNVLQATTPGVFIL